MTTHELTPEQAEKQFPNLNALVERGDGWEDTTVRIVGDLFGDPWPDMPAIDLARAFDDIGLNDDGLRVIRHGMDWALVDPVGNVQIAVVSRD
jgi:hypothetical protein